MAKLRLSLIIIHSILIFNSAQAETLQDLIKKRDNLEKAREQLAMNISSAPLDPEIAKAHREQFKQLVEGNNPQLELCTKAAYEFNHAPEKLPFECLEFSEIQLRAALPMLRAMANLCDTNEKLFMSLGGIGLTPSSLDEHFSIIVIWNIAADHIAYMI